jgi:hypothetical protein
MTNKDLMQILDRQIKKLIPEAETWLDFGNYTEAEKVLHCLNFVMKARKMLETNANPGVVPYLGETKA